LICVRRLTPLHNTLPLRSAPKLKEGKLSDSLNEFNVLFFPFYIKNACKNLFYVYLRIQQLVQCHKEDKYCIYKTCSIGPITIFYSSAINITYFNIHLLCLVVQLVFQLHQTLFCVTYMSGSYLLFHGMLCLIHKH
jgi:hypothetical protein